MTDSEVPQGNQDARATQTTLLEPSKCKDIKSVTSNPSKRWLKVYKRWYLDTDCVVWVDESTLKDGNFFNLVLLVKNHLDTGSFYKTVEEAMQSLEVKYG